MLGETPGTGAWPALSSRWSWRACSNESRSARGALISVIVFAFDSTRLVHVQEDQLNCWRPSGNKKIFIYTHAFHITLINTFPDSRFVTISIGTRTIIITTRFEIHPLPQDRPNGASGQTSSRSVFEIISHAIYAGEHVLAHPSHYIIIIYDTSTTDATSQTTLTRSSPPPAHIHIRATDNTDYLSQLTSIDARHDPCVRHPFTSSASSPTPCANPPTTPSPTTSLSTQRDDTTIYNINNISYSALHFIHQHNDYCPWNRPVSLQPLSNRQRTANL